MAWIFNNDPAYQNEGTNLTKDFFDSLLAGVTNQTPAWKIQQESDKITSQLNNTSNTTQNDDGGEDPSLSYNTAGGGGAPARDLAAEGFYQSGIDQTNNLISGLGGREQTAIQAILDSFTKGRERQDVAYKDNESDYMKTSDRLVRENAQKKSSIDNNVRNNVTALQRLLGARGAGSSSASKLVVPYAAAQQGTSQRAEATQVFTDNKDATDTNFNRYKREDEQARLDADAQLENTKRDVSSQFAEQGIAARQKLQELQTNLASARGGDAGAISAARSLSAQINELQQRITDLATRSQARTITAATPNYNPVATKAQSTDTTSVAQGPTPTAEQAADPTYDATAAYYGDAKELSDEELLKQLYG